MKIFLIFLIISYSYALNSIRDDDDSSERRFRRQAGSICTCVPVGTCSGNITYPFSGGGLIDIRIVNNPGVGGGGGGFLPGGGGGFLPGGAGGFQGSPPICQFNLVLCCGGPPSPPITCGRRLPPPINAPTGGAGTAAYGAYPWQAALLTTAGVYLGSGALIDARHVVTVAHKVVNVPPLTFKVRLGEWNAAGANEPYPAIDFTVVRVFINPYYAPANLFNDIAVLRLASPVLLGTMPTIATICLTPAIFTNAICWVSGWGRNAFGPTGSFQPIMKQVDVVMRTAADCQSRLRSTRLGANYVFNTTSFLCAGGEAGKDACTGDGGAPLVCESGGIWSLVGLVAWGIGCGTSTIPGVYVNVANYVPFIQAVVTTP